MKFEMSEAEVKKFREWREGVQKRGAEQQLAACATEEEREEMRRKQEYSGAPYTGAIGGSFTFMFTPTSIATSVVVKDGFTGEECDLTDYGAW